MRTPLLLTLALLASACDRETPAPPPRATTDSTVVDSAMALVARAAAVTLGAREFPGQSDSVLAASGLTIEQYEALLYRIAADPTLAALYRDAIGGKN
jgi:hypothetical protein